MLRTKSNQHLVSLPYVGFRGEYQNLRGIEKPIYEYTGSDKPFYYYKDKTDYPDGKIPDVEERHPDNHFTSLISYVYETAESVAKTLDSGQKSLMGTLYFSPNNDSSFDSVKVKAVMLRNVENVHLTVYKKEDTERKFNPFMRSEMKFIEKRTGATEAETEVKNSMKFLGKVWIMMEIGFQMENINLSFPTVHQPLVLRSRS